MKTGHLIKTSWRPYLIFDLRKADIVGDRRMTMIYTQYTLYKVVGKERAGLSHKTERSFWGAWVS